MAFDWWLEPDMAWLETWAGYSLVGDFSQNGLIGELSRNALKLLEPIKLLEVKLSKTMMIGAQML